MRLKTPTTLARIQAEIDSLKALNQFRQVGAISGVNFSSNDYLGMSRDHRLKQALRSELERDRRMCSTGSRLLSGHSEVWDDLESKLASFVGAEASVYFNSGYAANIGLLTAILRPEAVVFSDSANHASIIDGIRLSRSQKVIFPHADLNELERALRSTANDAERFIIIESIFGMDGDFAELEELYKLSERYDAALIIDEAHATGVVGPQGRGLVAESGRPACVLATVHTCGKAMASMGAFVACPQTLRDYLINKSRPFIFSTSLPPYVAAQTSCAVDIAVQANEERKHLCRLSQYLRTELTARGFDIGQSESQIVPVILGSNQEALRVAQHLTAKGFGVKAIRPPTVPAGSSRLRLSLTAAHQMIEITDLVHALTDSR